MKSKQMPLPSWATEEGPSTIHAFRLTPATEHPRLTWIPRLVTCRCGLRTFTAKGMATKHRGPLGPSLPVHTSYPNGSAA